MSMECRSKARPLLGGLVTSCLASVCAVGALLAHYRQHMRIHRKWTSSYRVCLSRLLPDCEMRVPPVILCTLLN